MKKLTVAGLAALGALGVGHLQAQPHFYSLAPNLSPQELSKVWSVAASVRGFYDDNYNTAPAGSEAESFGFEAQPSVSLNMPLENTYIGLRVDYSYRWYADDRAPQDDQTIMANLAINHSFSERFKLNFSDSFAYSREPFVVDSSGAVANPYRTDANNLRNRAYAELVGGITEEISAVVGYGFTYWKFDQEGFRDSRAGLLDRNENDLNASLRWQLRPETTLSVGYLLNIASFTSQDGITAQVGIPPTPTNLPSNTRNSFSQTFFAGIDHTFVPGLTGSLRGGYQMTEYPNTVPKQPDAKNPYVDAALSYNYNPSSFLSAGVRHTRAKTDVSSALDQVVTTPYIQWTHQITGRLSGSVLGQAQFGTFNGTATVNDQSEEIYVVGVSLAYRINPFLATEVGYNYDMLESDLPGRSYDRNRCYIGLRGIY